MKLTDNWYSKLLEDLKSWGALESPRGLETREFTHIQISMPIGTTVWTERFNPRIGIVEALALIAGVNSKEHLRLVAPKSVDDGWFDHGVNYGPRLQGQIGIIVEEMREQLDTRRAVLHIGHNRDWMPLERPCMQYVQFLVRNGQLSLHLAMRSWDSTRGFPSDIVVWGVVGLLVARCLNVEPGQLIATAGSWHLYKSEEPLVQHASVGPALQVAHEHWDPKYMGALIAWAREELRKLHKLGGRWAEGRGWSNRPNWLFLGDSVGAVDVYGYY